MNMEKNVYEKDEKKEEDEQKSLSDKDDHDRLSISYMDYRYVQLIRSLYYL